MVKNSTDNNNFDLLSKDALKKNKIKFKFGGTGLTFSNKLCSLLGFSFDKKLAITLLSNKQRQETLKDCASYQTKYYLEYTQKKMNQKNTQITFKTYKGIRYSKSLPVRGQRTHTNAQTAKKNNKNI